MIGKGQEVTFRQVPVMEVQGSGGTIVDRCTSWPLNLLQAGQYQIAVQQLECPINDSPATGGIEDLEKFRFDGLLKIGACPPGRADRAELQRLSVQFIPAKEAVAAGIAAGLGLRCVKDDERLLAING